MNTYENLKAKQIQWALNQGLKLQGSTGDCGVHAYTSSVDENLFESLSISTREQISSGDGGELASKGEQRARMQAVHSSSVLPVNVFQYWQSIGDFDAIAAACGFCRPGTCPSTELKFEEKFPILDDLPKHPNLDVTFINKPGSSFRLFAVESKFTEPYSSQPHGGIKDVYLKDESLWKELPNLRELAEEICPADKRFERLHAAQLIKHILGLSRASGKKGKFRLLYLWYDASGRAAIEHRDEIEDFTAIATKDGIKFHALTYQELIIKLAAQQREDHAAYVRYLTERYL